MVGELPAAQRQAVFWSPTDPAPFEAPVFLRSQLQPGQRIVGPALVLETTGSIVIDRGYRLFAGSDGVLRVTRDVAGRVAPAPTGSAPDPAGPRSDRRRDGQRLGREPGHAA